MNRRDRLLATSDTRLQHLVNAAEAPPDDAAQTDRSRSAAAQARSPVIVETNPAAQQNYFYIRQQNPKNRPNGEMFMHFFGMEVTWK